MNFNLILLGILGTQEILIILAIVLVLFGGRKIPELMKGMGRGVREFKDGMDGNYKKEDNDSEKKNIENSKDSESKQ